MTALAVSLLGGALVVAVLALRSRGHVDPELWPWFVDEVERAIVAGRSPQGAVLAVAAHGPPGLHRPAATALDAWRAAGDPGPALWTLQRAVADPRLDRVCTVVRAAEEVDGDVGAALEVLRSVAVADARHARRRRSAVRRSWIAAWLVPVLLVMARRDAGAVVAAAVVVAWALSAAVVMRRSRVLRGGP